MINIKNIASSALATTPFRYAIINGCIKTDDIRALLEALPKNNNYRSIRSEGSDKTYNVVNNLLLRLGESEPNKNSHLSTEWLKLVNELKSSDYITVLSKLLNEDLSSCNQEITLKRYGYNDFISAHTDKASVRATHMLFLNTHWDEDWGGSFCLMRDHQTTFNKIKPLAPCSVAFARSDCSWHSVDMITEQNAERIAIQVAFWNTSKRKVLDGRIEHTVDI